MHELFTFIERVASGPRTAIGEGDIGFVVNVKDEAERLLVIGREIRDEERQRIARIKRATCLGCLAAALGQPLHTVAESGFAARSYEGDAWEAGWEFINGSATWISKAQLEIDLAEARRRYNRLRDDVNQAADEGERIRVQ